MRAAVRGMLAAALAASGLAGQDQLHSGAKLLLKDYLADKQRNADNLDAVLSSSELGAYVKRRYSRERPRVVKIPLAALRNDQQIGSASLGTGSTSLVARSGATSWIGAALESGAVSRQTNDNSATLTFNALPVYQILRGQAPRGCGSDENVCAEGPGRWIRGLSTGVTFNRGTGEQPIPGVNQTLAGFLTGGGTVSAVTVRYELFVRERKSGGEAGLRAAAAALRGKIDAWLVEEADFETRMDRVPQMRPWREKAKQALQDCGKSLNCLEKTLLHQYRLAYHFLRPEVEKSEKDSELFALERDYVRATHQVLAEKLYRKALTFDYVHQTPANQPELSQFRLVFSTPLGRKKDTAKTAATGEQPAPGATLTMNAGGTVYHRPDGANLGRWRDVQFSSALEWPLGRWGQLGTPTAAIAGYYQYMIENAVIQFNQEAVTPGPSSIPLPKAAAEVLGTKGHIGIGQFRVSLPGGERGVTFPIAVSYSNRSELITGKPFWRGQIGVTYDLSRLGELFQ